MRRNLAKRYIIVSSEELDEILEVATKVPQPERHPLFVGELGFLGPDAITIYERKLENLPDWEELLEGTEEISVPDFLEKLKTAGQGVSGGPS